MTGTDGRVPEHGLLIRGEGVWLDPPPIGAAEYPQPPMPPWTPPYAGGAEPYPAAQRSIFPERGSSLRRRSTSWLDSFCPVPKRRLGESDQPGYPGWTGYPEQSGYGNAFMNGPPQGYREPWGR